MGSSFLFESLRRSFLFSFVENYLFDRERKWNCIFHFWKDVTINCTPTNISTKLVLRLHRERRVYLEDVLLYCSGKEIIRRVHAPNPRVFRVKIFSIKGHRSKKIPRSCISACICLHMQAMAARVGRADLPLDFARWLTPRRLVSSAKYRGSFTFDREGINHFWRIGIKNRELKICGAEISRKN